MVVALARWVAKVATVVAPVKAATVEHLQAAATVLVVAVGVAAEPAAAVVLAERQAKAETLASSK